MKTTLNEKCSFYERYAGTPSDIAKKLYFYIQWAGHFICKDNFYIERRGFKSILLLQTVKGGGILHYKNTEILLQPNNFVLIDCVEPHIYYPKKGCEWDFKFLHFSGNRSFELYTHICNLNGGYIFPATPTIESLIIDCINNCKTGDISAEAHTSKAISNILYETLLNIKPRENKMDRVCDYIKENYTKNLTTDNLAAVFGFSRSYFSTEFKKHTGTTIHDYLLCYRLYKAKILLTENKLAITQIAESTGFNDTGTFIRAFKKKEKLTPLQYKRNNIIM